ncbi:MAG: preprotein translocase subunit SecA [Planctomycetes bacterium]|nr:preprotein translocase subunit SecA [Planctomycetota bacterium]
MFRGVRFKRLLSQINALEKKISKLSDDEIRGIVDDMKDRRFQGEPLTAMLPEMFAMVREASKRTLGMRHYDVQILGGLALEDRCIAEMETGEGKTLVAPLAACLHALDNKGVHVVTVNDYLVHRDSEWMRPVYEFLGFRVRCILCDTRGPDRIKAHRADITYSTVRELGFDFCRESLAMEPERRGSGHNLNWMLLPPGSTRSQRDQVCLRGRNFAIVDETDSVLADFARSPISISEPSSEKHYPEVYQIADATARNLIKETDFTVDEARNKAELTDLGKTKAQELADKHWKFGLADSDWRDRLQDAITANFLTVAGRDYMVIENQVVLVDQITGRKMPGLRLGKHMHQALEAKERLTIQPNMMIVRSVNIQRLFEPYKHLCGMTGTAWEARREFKKVYKLGVVRLAPNKTMRRTYFPDRIYRSDEERWEAVIDDIVEQHEKGRPVLIGTRSVAKSEHLHELLEARNVPHDVLNAKQHAEEAKIIAEAGHKGRVTVSTSMAGRGTDIKLGPGVVEIGGLHIVGTERHELRRFDFQLGGRCGRQGDPGTVQYFASLEDEVLKIIPEKKLARIQRRYDNHKGPIKSRFVAGLFDTAQSRFRSYFSTVRQNLLEREKQMDKLTEILLPHG